MANEITTTFQTLLSNSTLKDSHSSGQIAIDQASAKVTRNVQTITTLEVALELGGITTPGVCMFQNLDDTNFVEIGVSGTMVIKLKPGEQYCVRLTTLAPFAKADIAPVELFYIIYED